MHSVKAVQNELNEARTDTQTNKQANRQTDQRKNKSSDLLKCIDMTNTETGKWPDSLFTYICDTDHRAIQHKAHRSQIKLIYGRDKGAATRYDSLARSLAIALYIGQS